MNATRSAQIIAALLPLVASPALVHAEPAPDPKMEACIQAFLEASVEKDRPVTVRRLVDFDNSFNPSARQQTIHVSARLKGSGKRVATATCEIDGDRLVLTVDGKRPVMTKVAQADAAQ